MPLIHRLGQRIGDTGPHPGSWPSSVEISTDVGRLVGTGAYAGKLKEEFPRWAASIKSLAAHENVYVKVGGLGQSINGLGFEKQAEPPRGSADVVGRQAV
jgi:L-fuconolactonase